MTVISEIILKYAAENALAHGQARPQNIIGRVIGEKPELKKDMAGTMKEIEKIVAKVNKMGKAELEKVAASHAVAKKEESKKGTLPDLPNVAGHVVMRFAPNPSGLLHIGHARTAIINDEYVKRYGGRYILRVEDTDPDKVEPDAYKEIEADLKWLGIKIDEVIVQSKRLAIYRDFAVRLMRQGNAYVCSCGQEAFKKLKDVGKECPCRANSVEKNLELWKKMLKGDNTLVLNLKTDMQHKNPAMRDFPIMRVSKDRHPLTGKEFDVYPLMNFSVTIDDHLLGLTHVLRGKDHIMNTERQRFIYEYLGWKPPEIIHHGLLDIVGVELSKSVIKKAIANGEYTGWDDPRLGTLKAIKQRGIEPEAIRSIMKMIGIGEVDSTFDWKNLYAENRKIIEPMANRYFFVPDPEEVWISGMPKEPNVIRVPLHLDHPERGYREIRLKIEKDATRIFIAAKDADKLKKGDEIRLKNFCNLKIDEHEPLKASYVEAKNLKVPIIQWLPKEVMGCEVLGPEGRVAGFCEMACKELTPGTIIQFERFGFCRIASVDGNDVICYYTHD